MIFTKELFEDLNKINDDIYLWDDPEVKEYPWDETLDGETFEDILLNYNRVDEMYGGMPFEDGDIVMATNPYDEVIDPHRIYLIDGYIDNYEGPIYYGYLLSSVTDKANVNNEKYPKNILIKNYSSIIQRGRAVHTDVVIKLDKRFKLNNSHFNASSWKGHTTEEFQKFVDYELYKINMNQDTSKDVWDSTEK